VLARLWRPRGKMTVLQNPLDLQADSDSDERLVSKQDKRRQEAGSGRMKGITNTTEIELSPEERVIPTPLRTAGSAIRTPLEAQISNEHQLYNGVDLDTNAGCGSGKTTRHDI
jgi:hypothetical protein